MVCKEGLDKSGDYVVPSSVLTINHNHSPLRRGWENVFGRIVASQIVSMVILEESSHGWRSCGAFCCLVETPCMLK